MGKATNGQWATHCPERLILPRSPPQSYVMAKSVIPAVFPTNIFEPLAQHQLVTEG